MVAKLWTNQIILKNKTYKEVPNGLKNQVKELLISSGHPALVIE